MHWSTLAARNCNNKKYIIYGSNPGVSLHNIALNVCLCYRRKEQNYKLSFRVSAGKLLQCKDRQAPKINEMCIRKNLTVLRLVGIRGNFCYLYFHLVLLLI
jgi:hypothetical protein